MEQVLAQKASEHSGKKKNEFEDALRIEREAFNGGRWYWQKVAWATADSVQELRLLESISLTELAEARLWKLMTG